MIFSIDPGTTGKIVVMSSDSIEVLDMPVEEVLTGKKTKKGNPCTR